MESYGKRVLAKIKGNGLDDIGEEALKVIWAALCDELVIEVNNNDKVWDNLLAKPIEYVKDMGLLAIDKIDGEVG